MKRVITFAVIVAKTLFTTLALQSNPFIPNVKIKIFWNFTSLLLYAHFKNANLLCLTNINSVYSSFSQLSSFMTLILIFTIYVSASYTIDSIYTDSI